MQNVGIDLFDNDDQYIIGLPNEFCLLDDLGEGLEDDLGSDLQDDTAP